MKRSAIIYLLLGFSLPLIAAGRPIATLKAEYNVISHNFNKSSGDTIQTIEKFILQIAPEKSYYYNPQTFFVDSMNNDPNGRLLIEHVWAEALQTSMSDQTKNLFDIIGKQGFLSESNYRCLKEFDKENIRVWDSNMGSKYRYDLEMDDLSWELGDSIKAVLGYECQNAFTNYHGRKWEAWFTTDIPFRDGPWQLHGLPGLIMEATTNDKLYSFEIKGIQQCNEPFKPTFEDDKYFITNRKAFLKTKDYSRKNRSGMVNVMTNGNVNLSNSINATEKDIDFIETDYKE